MTFVIAENGTVDSTTSNVVDILYWNSNVYYQNASGNWFKRNLITKTWGAISLDPRLTVGTISTKSKKLTALSNGSVAVPNAESGQGIIVPPATSVIDATGEVFTIVSAQVAVNGVVDTTTSFVVNLLYWNHNVYQYNGANWYFKSISTATWQGPVPDPRIPVESTQGTTVPPSASVIDASGETFTIVSSQVAVNGVVDTTTSFVVQLLYWNHNVYQYNGGSWYFKAISTAVWQGPTTDPRLTTGIQALSADSVVETMGVHWKSDPGNEYSSATNLTTLVNLAKGLGIRYLRQGVYGDGPTSTYATTLKGFNTSNGIKFNFVIDIRVFPTPANAVTAIINNLGVGLASAIETINEPENAGLTAQQIVTYQQQVFQAVRAQTSLNGVLVHGPSFLSNSLAVACANLGISQWMDGATCHPYNGPKNPENATNTSVALTYTNLVAPIRANMPTIYSESGTDSGIPGTGTAPGVANNIWMSESAESIYQVRWILYNFVQPNAPIRMYKYEFFDESGAGSLHEDTFGMVRNNLTVKPIYTTTKNFISLIQDKGATFTQGSLNYTLTGATTNIFSVLLGKRDGSFIVALWNTSPIVDTTTFLDIAQPAAQAVNINVSGVTGYQTALPTNTGTFSTVLNIINGTVPVSVTSSPLLVQFQPSANVVGIQALSSDALVDLIGVNTHFEYPVYNAVIPTLVPLLGNSGIRHIRCAAITVNTPTNFISTLQTLRDTYGIKFNIGIFPTEGTAAAQVTWIKNNIGVANVMSVEGVNEPTDATSTYTWQQTMYNAVRADSTFNNVKVLGPSILSTTVAQAAVNLGMSSFMDNANIHNYLSDQNPDSTGGNDFASQLPLVNIQKSGVPHYYTECGAATENPYNQADWGGNGIWMDEVTQGIHIVRYYLNMLTIGTTGAPARAYIYEFYDEAGLGLRESNFGIIETNFTPKLIYTTLKNLIALTTDPGVAFTPGKLNYTLSGSLTNIKSTLLGKRNGNFIVAVWNTVNIFNPQTGAVLALPATQSVNINVTGVTRFQTAIPNSTGTYSSIQNVVNGVVTINAGSQVTLVQFLP